MTLRDPKHSMPKTETSCLKQLTIKYHWYTIKLHYDVLLTITTINIIPNTTALHT